MVMPKGFNLGNIFKDKTIGAGPGGMPSVVTKTEPSVPAEPAVVRMRTADDYINRAKAAWAKPEINVMGYVDTKADRMASILSDLQSDLASGLIGEEEAIRVLRSPFGPNRVTGGMDYREATGMISGWNRAAGADAFRGFGDQLPDSMLEGMGAAGTASPGAGAFGWTDEGWDPYSDEATEQRLALEEAERQAALKKSSFELGKTPTSLEQNLAEAERKRALATMGEGFNLVGSEFQDKIDVNRAKENVDIAKRDNDAAKKALGDATTDEEKAKAKADADAAKKILDDANTNLKNITTLGGGEPAKKPIVTTTGLLSGVTDLTGLRNAVLSDTGGKLNSLDIEGWLKANGYTSSEASTLMYNMLKERDAGVKPTGDKPTGDTDGSKDVSGGMVVKSGAQQSEVGTQPGVDAETQRQMIQMRSAGALPTPIQSGIGLGQAMATPGEAFQQYRLSQYGGQPSAAELARAQRTGALYTGFQPSYGRFLLSATRPTSDIELGAFGDEQAEGEAFARFLRSGQRAPIGDVRSAYGGLADYLTQISQGGMPGGESGLRYGAVFGQDLGPQQIKGNLLETTMASLGMAPGMGGRTYRNLANIYDTMQAQYGQEAGAANFANWVSGGLGNQSSPNAFNSFNPTQSTYTPAQQTAIRKMRPTSSDIINRQAMANEMTGGYIGGGWNPRVTDDLEDVMVTGGGF